MCRLYFVNKVFYLFFRLYQLVDSPNPHMQLQSLRLLVNLACNRDMIPSLLAAEVSTSSLNTLMKQFYITPTDYN